MKKSPLKRILAVGTVGLMMLAGTTTSASAAEVGTVGPQYNVPCSVQQWSNQVRIHCSHSSRYARGKIACRSFPDQYTNWIKDGYSYSPGCPVGVNDLPGGPVTIEVGGN
ncbi:hypothetical protein [Bifidobacterium sp. ESL0704]|uniref:hypothetical protein n=1 Tax=Bifidobacterium sp. ESL0704 TaxID=2983219 RepID=UPI0023F71076|nr:hypothetical protein [Bifidobacterium sp. ESL0704]WEV52272.1 hypothetical protein OZX64_05010 [Bifidobacterium sp. ESL0704]